MTVADEKQYSLFTPSAIERLVHEIKDRDSQILLAAQQYTRETVLEEIQGLIGTEISDETSAETLSAVLSMQRDIASLQAMLEGKVDDGYATDEGYLYLSSNGIDVAGPIGPFASGGGGGGGGGSSNSAKLTMTNSSGTAAFTVASGDACNISVTWSSIEDEIPTGNGTLTVLVGSATRLTKSVAQGLVTVDVSNYLSSGTNTVTIRIQDIYGNTKNMRFTVELVAISLSSSFDYTVVQTGDITFTYTPVGAVEKTIHFLVDGSEIATVTTSYSGRQMTQIIPAQTHGHHTIRSYFTCTISENVVQSNELYFDVICTEEGNNTVIIASQFNETSVPQYSTLSLPYRVYDPQSLTTAVEIYAANALDGALTVDRTVQTYTHRCSIAGALVIEIVAGETTRTFNLTVEESSVTILPETSGLSLYLGAVGRSNSENNPAQWVYENIYAQFTNFNWSSNGWIQDADGNVALRLTGNARCVIPYQIFSGDFRTTGKTIEIEFSTSGVMDYDTPVVSCMAGGRGIEVTPQLARISSEQSSIQTQFKEDEHVRLSFVVEKRTENRFIHIYIDGVLSGTVIYPEDDDFSQAVPVGITLGSNGCTTDVYCIRVYDIDLGRNQVVNNWIADTQDSTLMLERYLHNDVFDDYGEIVISKLPQDLPYIIIACAELPQYKGDKKNADLTYVDPLHPEKSYTVSVSINVQGTSSQYYPRKNYKFGAKSAFTLTDSGQTSDTYQLTDDSIATDSFCLKADVASSEGANNVELVRLFEIASPYKTPAQAENSLVRQGIDGFPIVVFWQDTTTDTITFIGKYNANNDKGTEEVFGFTEGDESWEIKNNTSDRVIFKNDDFTSTMVNDKGETILAWLNDFEGRYPDGNEDGTQLHLFISWLKSTDPEQATGGTDTAAARLQKFHDELPDWVELDSALYYYIFTELFLMVDSRAKNAFPSFIGSAAGASTGVSKKVVWLPYDFDTAIGTNNEGDLVFSYDLEDTDHLPSGADIFNGQNSVMWNNLRDTYGTEILTMYQSLRSEGKLSYAVTEQMFETHQAKWPESIFNEDSYFKYLYPYIYGTKDSSGQIVKTASYLPMLQGSKANQRKWWLYHRFRYLDSKYSAGDALTDVITVRGYAKSDITLTPFLSTYVSIKYGSYITKARGTVGIATTLACPLTEVNDTEIYIYSASRLADVGDLSGLKVGFADFSAGTRLANIKVGSDAEGYTNGNLTQFYVGSCGLLRTVDCRNCTALSGNIDLSNAPNLREAYFDGTIITAVSLADGGVLETLHLPSTVTSLTLLNQHSITDLVLPNPAGITTLRVENSDIDALPILMAMASGSRVRLIGAAITAANAETIYDLYDQLDLMRGLDATGGNTTAAQVSGTIAVPYLWRSDYTALSARYTDLVIVPGSIIEGEPLYTRSGAPIETRDGEQIMAYDSEEEGT